MEWQGYTISPPCEPNGSGELIIGGRDTPKLIERTNDRARKDPDRNDPFTYARSSCQQSVKSESKNRGKIREINYNFMAKNRDQIFLFPFL